VKYLVFAMLFMSPVVFSETLTTDNFVIEVERGCEEGVVTCDTIKFIYLSVGIKQKQTVVGKTVHTKCADGITPCAFQGYKFQSDGAKYFIHNSGVLEVTDSEGNQLLVEQGKWQH
jgi:hypothetical protein